MRKLTPIFSRWTGQRVPRQPLPAGAAELVAALKRHPEENGTRIRLAHLLFDGGQAQEAREHYLEALRRADSADSELFKLYASLGACLEVEGRSAEAVVCYERALELNPLCAPAHWNLAELYRRSGDEPKRRVHEEALASLELGPTLRLRRALQMPVIAPNVDALAAWRVDFPVELEDIAARCDGKLTDPESEINATGLYIAYQGGNDAPLAGALTKTIRRFYRPPVRPLHVPRAGKRIRIGLVSAFFHNHSIGRLYRGLVRELDRRKFEVTVLSIEHRSDETARLIERLADRFIALPGRVSAVAEAVSAAQLDVLYFPEIGLHPVPYYLAFWRLAPLQCVSYGHPATTGIDTVDCFLSAPGLDPLGAECHYTERLVRLPGFFMPAYERPAYPHFAKEYADFGARPGERVYFCPQTLIKFHPDFDAVLAAILRRDPSAVVTLIDATVSEWRPALTARFARVMPDVCHRIRFIPPQPTADYFNLLRAAAAVLDTFPFGGGISAMDAFAAGAPLVTLEGEYFRGRQAAACYREMAIAECVVHTPEAYVATALRLANDSAFRGELAARIEAASPRLFGRLDSVRALEDFLQAELAGAPRNPRA